MVQTVHDAETANKGLEGELLTDLVIIADLEAEEESSDLLKKLREDFIFQNIPVIIYSVHTERETVIRFLQIGIQNYLLCPSPKEKIIASVEKAIGDHNWRAKLCPYFDSGKIPEKTPTGVPIKRYRETLTALNWFLPKLAKSLEVENFQQVNAALKVLSFLARETGITVLKDLIIDFSMSSRPETRNEARHTLSRIEILRNLLQNTLGHSKPEAPVEPEEQEDTTKEAPLLKKPPALKKPTMEQSGEEVFEAISQLEHLPVMEPVFSFIQEGALFGQIGLDDAVDLVKMEAGLCLQVLALANSTYVAPQHSVDDLESALQLIGLDNLQEFLKRTRNITPMEKLFTAIEGSHLWAHQVGTARLCVQVNDLLNFPKIPHAYMAGLLHDVGKVLLAYLFPRQYNAVLEWSIKEKIPLTEAEYSCFSMTHEEAGASFLESHRLPGPVKAAVRFHRHPEKALSEVELAAIVNISNFLCKNQGIGFSGSLVADSSTGLKEQAGWEILREHIHPRFGENDFENELLERSENLKQEVQLSTLQLA